MKTFNRVKFIGTNWVTVLQPTKREAKVLKDKAIPLGTILYIGKDFERTTAYYQVGSKTVAVQIQTISHNEAEKLMASYPDDFVHGYIKSNTIFPDDEVLIDTALLDYGLYVAVDETEAADEEEDTSEDCGSGLELCPHEEEDTSEDCSDGSELWADEEDDMEDYSEDYSDGLELCSHEEEDTEEATSEDCSSGLELCPHEEEDTSEDCSDGSELCAYEEDDMEDYSDILELCPQIREDTSEDYIETTNVCGVEIKNYCISFGETMLVHEAVEDNLNDFLVDLSLERLALFGGDIDCTLGLDEQYNNMVTGFIMFGAALSIFTFDATRSKDIYLNYLARTYNLSKWGVQMLSDLIDLGINLNSSVIEPHSFTLHNCLKSFIHTVNSCIRFKSQCDLTFEQIVEKLTTEDWFDEAAKFYLTMVCWGKFKSESYIDDDSNVDDYDYPVATENYIVNLELCERDDMYAVLISVAKSFNLDTELIEKYSDDDISKDIAIYILNKWGNPQNKKLKVLSNKEQIKLKVLAHIIKKLKGVH